MAKNFGRLSKDNIFYLDTLPWKGGKETGEYVNILELICWPAGRKI